MLPPEEYTTFGGIFKDASYFLKKEKKIIKIALIAHDKKKEEIIDLAKKYKEVLAEYELYATGTAGTLIMGETALPIHRMKSGPLGGDQQIGAMLANGYLSVCAKRNIIDAKHHIIYGIAVTSLRSTSFEATPQPRSFVPKMNNDVLALLEMMLTFGQMMLHLAAQMKKSNSHELDFLREGVR